MNKRHGEVGLLIMLITLIITGLVIGFALGDEAGNENGIIKGKYIAMQEAEKFGYTEKVMTSSGEGYKWVIPASNTVKLAEKAK